MTWYFAASEQNVSIWWNDSKIATDVSFSGAWDSPAPDVVYTEAVNHIIQEAGYGNIETAIEMMGELLADDIEAGVPP